MLPADELDDEVLLLRERLALGIATYRRPRSLAVLSISVNANGGAALPDADVAGRVHREIARSIRRCLAGSDSIASAAPLRYVVLLERSEDGPFAMHAADRIVQAVAGYRTPEAPLCELAASIGISVHPDDGEEVEELVRCADAAAEAAEAGGGHLFGFYSQPMNARLERRARIERALVGAVEREEFRLCYQPQIDSRDGSLIGAEALLRFESGVLGPVSPAEFIPVLESTGGIVEVGSWVLDRACTDAAEWMRSGRPVHVSVNVSARQLAAPDFERDVLAALERSGLPSGQLELELTESVLVENPVETRRRIETVRSGGVRIALDDFGTGYASLAYIRQFPLDALKIDRQFVRGLPVDAEAVAITSAIVALARSLRLDIVAEGVENEAEEEFLHSLHCFVIQGYLHARPMARDDFDAWRRKRPWA
jgi:EAL domain-containing protein (putative c-di-GMP-specific phosphodiesterase class I)